MATLQLFHSMLHDFWGSNKCSYKNLSTTVLENCPVKILEPAFAKICQMVEKLK